MNKKNQMLANKMVKVAKSLMALSADDEAKVMVDYMARRSLKMLIRICLNRPMICKNRLMNLKNKRKRWKLH